jgi:hypothetical protein
MSKPLAICIEDVGSQSKTRYMRCVALPGRQPGLRLDETGQVLWRSDEGVSCELWVSADDRLVLYRPEGAPAVFLHRAGRSLDVPYGKPVFVIDKDEVDVGSRHLRIHVHGQSPSIAAPSPLPSRARPLSSLAQAATAAAIVGAVTALGCSSDIIVRDNPPEPTIPTDPPTIEVRDDPPEMVMPSETPASTVAPTIEVRDDPPEIALPEISVAEAIQGEWAVAQAYDVGDGRTWITGTLIIEGDLYAFESAQQAVGPSVQGVLDFLFDAPTGEVAIEYEDGVMPDDDFYAFAPVDTLVVCRFYAGSEVIGEFLIKVGDSSDLYFYSLSGEGGLWSVTKQVEADY